MFPETTIFFTPNAEPKKIRPAADPFPGGAGWPKFTQLETVATFTYRPSLVKVDVRNFELSWLQTHAQSTPARLPVANTQTGPITIHYTATLSAQCNKQHITCVAS